MKTRKETIQKIRDEILDQVVRLEIDVKYWTRAEIKDIDPKKSSVTENKINSKKQLDFKREILDIVDELLKEAEKLS